MVTFDFAKTPITQIADAIIIDASRKGASDIHLDPRDNGIMVRIRIDGDLEDYAYIPKTYERNLTTRIKLMSNMNITESRLPQDGAIKGTFSGKELDMRVSCLPTNEGEKIVIRILDYTRSLSGIEKLGFNKENYEKLLRMIDAPNGIILVTGATGSGKSTTVYSILQVLNKERTNIITVEDPIEMNIEGLNQVQVNAEIGLDFATVLRSILRQDPNVILIGEIRDSETAQIAVRASITGHLVLSTIHTNSSLSTIERLLDMNVEKYLLSSAITGIISQRLAKMLCPKCRVKRQTTPYEKKVFKLALKKDVEEIYDAHKIGCQECNKGYLGRIAIQEVLEIDDEIKSAINNTTTDREELRKLVYGTGNVITLLQDGLEKVLEGLTSFDEIYRIIEIDNDIDDSCMEAMTQAKTEKEEQKQIMQKQEQEKKQEEIKKVSQAEVKTETSSVIPNSPEKKEVETTSQVSSIMDPTTKQELGAMKGIINNFFPDEEKKKETKNQKEESKKYSESYYPDPNLKRETKDSTNEKKTSNSEKEDRKYSKDYYPNPNLKEETKNSENKEADSNLEKEESKKYSKGYYPNPNLNNKAVSQEQQSNSFFPNPDITANKEQKNHINDLIFPNINIDSPMTQGTNPVFPNNNLPSNK